MEYIAAGCVVIGVGWTSYLIGVKDGGAKMIDMLELLKIIIVMKMIKSLQINNTATIHRSKK